MESSVIEARQLLENLIYDEKKRFAISSCGRLQGQKNPPPSPTTTTQKRNKTKNKNKRNHLQKCLKCRDPSSPPLCGCYKLMPVYLKFDKVMLFE